MKVPMSLKEAFEIVLGAIVLVMLSAMTGFVSAAAIVAWREVMK